jgi:hypothetical protein
MCASRASRASHIVRTGGAARVRTWTGTAAPVTPGPVVPAREQLGELLLNLKRPQEALQEFRVALTSAPRRRGALVRAIAAAERVGDTRASAQFRGELER